MIKAATKRASWVDDITYDRTLKTKKEENNIYNYKYIIEIKDGKYKVTAEDNIKFSFNKVLNPNLTKYIDNFLKKIKKNSKFKEINQIDIHIILDKDEKIITCQIEINKNGRKETYQLDEDTKKQLGMILSSLKQKTINKQKENSESEPFLAKDINEQQIPKVKSENKKVLVRCG